MRSEVERPGIELGVRAPSLFGTARNLVACARTAGARTPLRPASKRWPAAGFVAPRRTKPARRIGLLVQVRVLMGLLVFTSSALAGGVRQCDYLDEGTVTVLLGLPAQLNPKGGQIERHQGRETHRCTWLAHYPAVAPGAPSNPVSVEVVVTRYTSAERMRADQLQTGELAQLKIDKLPQFGDSGAFTTSVDLHTAVMTASKARILLSISVAMGLNPLRSNTRDVLLNATTRLFRTI